MQAVVLSQRSEPFSTLTRFYENQIERDTLGNTYIVREGGENIHFR
jgi:hypothetical protein